MIICPFLRKIKRGHSGTNQNSILKVIYDLFCWYSFYKEMFKNAFLEVSTRFISILLYIWLQTYFKISVIAHISSSSLWCYSNVDYKINFMVLQDSFDQRWETESIQRTGKGQRRRGLSTERGMKDSMLLYSNRR